MVKIMKQDRSRGKDFELPTDGLVRKVLNSNAFEDLTDIVLNCRICENFDTPAVYRLHNPSTRELNQLHCQLIANPCAEETKAIYTIQF